MLDPWLVHLDAESVRIEGIVFASDEERARVSATTATEEGGCRRVRFVRAERIVHDEERILDLHSHLEPGPAPAIPGRVWWVPAFDGLFHRPEGASVVIADDAESATRLVAAADPFEGQPPYGKPAQYGPAKPFVLNQPTVLWLNFESCLSTTQRWTGR